MQSTTSVIKLTIHDGITVCLPDSAGLMTPYVLREQNDWFEDEIHFIRKLIRPGMQVLDISRLLRVSE